MKNRIQILLICFMFAALSFVNAQSGGNFLIDGSVIANGGDNSANGRFSITGTTAQPAAGANMSGGIYAVRGGMWAFGAFAPTQAGVSIGGRVLSSEGRGMQNTLITLTRSDGTIKTAISNPFGYFRIDNVAAGETYIISARSKSVQFANQTQVVFVSENITDLVFNAFPE